MIGTSNKVLLAGIVFLIGAFAIITYSAAAPNALSHVSEWTISEVAPEWSVWDYLALFLFLCSTGLTIAGIKLRR